RPVRTRMPGGVGGDRSDSLTAPIPIAWNRSRTAFYSNGERRNKLLLYGHKSGTYYAPVFSLNLINSRYENIPFLLVNRSFRFYSVDSRRA
ncbi:hypothetical protein, partial [Burkholderia sp. MSMB1078WGS]|uniref:hypothetical protein n=1 Tax=Burkholderia sp. MSMB1078WGS TaxID=1637900 RepID=UPI001C54EBF5